MSNVIDIDCVTCLDLPVEKIFKKAEDAKLEDVLIIGWTKDGDLFFAASMAEGPENLWLLEKTKKALLEATI